MRFLTTTNTKSFFSGIMPVLLLLIVSFPAVSAENYFVFSVDFRTAMMDSETEVSVDIFDEVSDGCWTNTSRSKARVERVLVSSGYSNLTSENASIRIELDAIGYSTSNNNCAVVATFSVVVRDFDSLLLSNANWVFVSRQNIFRRQSMFTGGRQDMSNRILEYFSSAIDEFVVFVEMEKNRARTEIENSEASQIEKARILDRIR